MSKKKNFLYLDEMIKRRERRDLSATPEAEYVKKLPWQLVGSEWMLIGIPSGVKSKLKDIFTLWSVGWHASTDRCGPGHFNVFTGINQMNSVGINLESKTGEQNETVVIQDTL